MKVFLSSVGLLAFATLTNWLLLMRSPQNQTFHKVKSIIKGWWIIVLFLLLCISYPPYTLHLGFGLFSLICVREYLVHSELSALKRTIFIFSLLLVSFQFYAISQQNWAMMFALPIISVLISFPVVTILRPHIAQLPLVFASLVGLGLMLHYIAYLPAIYTIQAAQSGKEGALTMVALIILLTEINDVFQFLGGKTFGVKKFVPEISPNKTGAGFVTGIICTTALSTIAWNYFLDFSFIKSACLGLIIAVMGILGDLTFSAVKRYFEIKDFSNRLPGHGGVLDRMDSLIFTSPMIFYFLFFTGGYL
jgi:phosphatidate cytidylyltransferase